MNEHVIPNSSTDAPRGPGMDSHTPNSYFKLYEADSDRLYFDDFFKALKYAINTIEEGKIVRIEEIPVVTNRPNPPAVEHFN
jgi:hypothetical protein